MTIKSHTDSNGRTTITVTILGPIDISTTMSLGEWSRLIANPITIIEGKAA